MDDDVLQNATVGWTIVNGLKDPSLTMEGTRYGSRRISSKSLLLTSSNIGLLPAVNEPRELAKQLRRAGRSLRNRGFNSKVEGTRYGSGVLLIAWFNFSMNKKRG